MRLSLVRWINGRIISSDASGCRVMSWKWKMPCFTWTGRSWRTMIRCNIIMILSWMHRLIGWSCRRWVFPWRILIAVIGEIIVTCCLWRLRWWRRSRRCRMSCRWLVKRRTDWYSRIARITRGPVMISDRYRSRRKGKRSIWRWRIYRFMTVLSGHTRRISWR